MVAPKVKRTPAKISMGKPSFADVETNPVIRIYLRVEGEQRRTFEIDAKAFTLALFGESETPCELVEVIHEKRPRPTIHNADADEAPPEVHAAFENVTCPASETLGCQGLPGMPCTCTGNDYYQSADGRFWAVHAVRILRARGCKS